MNTNPIIYLDNAATTPVAPEVLAAMLPCLQGACRSEERRVGKECGS